MGEGALRRRTERDLELARTPTPEAVGGTSLKLTTSGARQSETLWNNSGRPSHPEEFKQYSATGGGCSTLFTAPSWQQSVPGWASTTAISKRSRSQPARRARRYVR